MLTKFSLIFSILFTFPLFAQTGIFDEIAKKNPHYEPFTDAFERGNRSFKKISILDNNQGQEDEWIIATLKEGTPLIRIKDEKSFLLTQHLNVKIHRYVDEQGHHLIKNKEGESTFKVFWKDTEHTTKVTNLDVPPIAFVPVAQLPPPTYDSEFNFRSDFLLHLGMIIPDYSRELTGERNLVYTSNRIELANHFRWDNPIKIGMSAQWENATAKLSYGTIQQQTLSIGPTVRYSLSHFDLTSQVRWAAYSRLKQITNAETVDQKLSMTALNFGFEIPFKAQHYTLLLGGNFERRWVKANSKTYAIDVADRANTEDSFFLSLGLAKDWTW